MNIPLNSLWPIENLSDYKVHFARYNQENDPLEVFARSRKEWQEWQEYWPSKNDFNREFIFAIVQYDIDAWLFGGVYRVLVRHADRYEVELGEIGRSLIGRLIIHLPHRGRTTRAKLENHFDNMMVKEILPNPYYGREFPGYENINLSFHQLETIVRNAHKDWQAPLAIVAGVYLITDDSTGKRYVGSAYGDRGVWARWCQYINTGHGGNFELKSLASDPSLDYCRANFRFTLLEHHARRTPDQSILNREVFWKNALGTRGAFGLNRN